jgi:hypothetical protein
VPLSWLDSGGTARRIALVTGTNTIQIGDVDNALATPLLLKAGTDSQFFTAGTEKARIATDGTLLVGTTTDSAGALDVNGAIRHNGTQAYWLKGTTSITSGSGTYTVPAGVRAIRVRMVGGGGGGGYARGQTAAGARCSAGGAQSGYYVEAFMTGLGASYSYAVGAAGVGGVAATATDATNGGDTTFSTFTANGGRAGRSCTETANVFTRESLNAGAPARAANAGATINAFGLLPGIATDDNNDIMVSYGGASILEGGNTYGPHTSDICTLGTTVVGKAGAGVGGGGGGACAWRNGANVESNGGAGVLGVIHIEEYF